MWGKARKAGNGNHGKPSLAYRLVLFLILLVMTASAAILLFHLAIVPGKNRQMMEQLKEDFSLDLPPEGDSLPEEPAGKENVPSLVDLAALQEKYPDVKGWLTIPDTGIDYPVLQGTQEEPEYYLRRNYKGEYDINGSLFLQWNCPVPEGENLIIYGHNMNSGAMFGNLERYAEAEYRKEHPTIFFQTVEGVQEYTVSSVLKADVSMFDFRQVSFSGLGSLQEYLSLARSLEVSGNDQLSPAPAAQVLTLVTCSYEWNGARNIVIAVQK